MSKRELHVVHMPMMMKLSFVATNSNGQGKRRTGKVGLSASMLFSSKRSLRDNALFLADLFRSTDSYSTSASPILYIVPALDVLIATGQRERMTTRRSRFSPLETVNANRWLVVRSEYGTLLEHRQLPAGSDLKAALVTCLAEHAHRGYTLEDFSSSLSCAFVHQGNKRLQIGIEVQDPMKSHSYGNVTGFKPA